MTGHNLPACFWPINLWSSNEGEIPRFLSRDFSRDYRRLMRRYARLMRADGRARRRGVALRNSQQARLVFIDRILDSLSWFTYMQGKCYVFDRDMYSNLRGWCLFHILPMPDSVPGRLELFASAVDAALRLRCWLFLLAMCDEVRDSAPHIESDQILAGVLMMAYPAYTSEAPALFCSAFEAAMSAVNRALASRGVYAAGSTSVILPPFLSTHIEVTNGDSPL